MSSQKDERVPDLLPGSSSLERSHRTATDFLQDVLSTVILDSTPQIIALSEVLNPIQLSAWDSHCAAQGFCAFMSS